MKGPKDALGTGSLQQCLDGHCSLGPCWLLVWGCLFLVSILKRGREIVQTVMQSSVRQCMEGADTDEKDRFGLLEQ